MGKKKILKKLEQGFGTVPNVDYFAGDMQNIASYFDYRRAHEPEEFLLDETTWYDLDLDVIYKRINPGLTTSGEQYLYYMLRHPAVTEDDFDERQRLISTMEHDGALRLKLQFILYKLGKSRNAVLNQAFDPEYHGIGHLILYIGLVLLFFLSVAAAVFLTQKAVLAAVAVFSLNMFIHTKRLNAIRRDFDTVNYSLSMLRAMDRIRRLKNDTADSICAASYDSLSRFRSSLRLGGVGDIAGSELGSLVGILLLWDLILYEFQKNKLWRNHDDLFKIHESLGKLDAAIAVASYIKSLSFFCRPALDFTPGQPAYIQAGQMAHPMLKSPVLNDLDASGPVLLTGSNASGKSTYIKTAIICAIMAQSIGVCTAASYSARAFRMYSSMAVTDDLVAGESYYIAEIRSLKRIFDAAGYGVPVMAVIDEVLRGTNTIERIAASAEVLRALDEKGALCLAATHDIELCALLQEQYALYHFEESVTSDAMSFDYKIKPGPAGTRNAINLLRLMGFDDEIVKRAHERANRYLETGVWSDAGTKS